MLRSWDIQVFCIFNNSMIHENSYVMVSISTWYMVQFLIYLLNHNSLTHQAWSIDKYKQGQYFSQIFWTIWWTGAKFQTLFSLAACSNFSITSYVKFPVFHFFEKTNKGELRMVNINY